MRGAAVILRVARKPASSEPTTVSSTGGATWTYVSATGYYHFGQPLKYTLPTAGGTAWVSLNCDPQTRALNGIQTTDSTTSGDVDNLTYRFDSPRAGLG